jgi:hypothetical protein
MVYHNVMGGDYHCRTCGNHHGSAIAMHYGMESVSPLQEAQMAVEEAEKVIKEIHFRSIGRKKVNDFFAKLRQNFGIPDKPIFVQKDYSDTRLKRGRKKRKTINFGGKEVECMPVMNATMLKKIKKAQKARTKDRSFRLIKEQILAGKEIFQNIKIFIERDAFMTEGQEKDVEEIFKKLEVKLKISV